MQESMKEQLHVMLLRVANQPNLNTADALIPCRDGIRQSTLHVVISAAKKFKQEISSHPLETFPAVAKRYCGSISHRRNHCFARIFELLDYVFIRQIGKMRIHRFSGKHVMFDRSVDESITCDFRHKDQLLGLLLFWIQLWRGNVNGHKSFFQFCCAAFSRSHNAANS